MKFQLKKTYEDYSITYDITEEEADEIFRYHVLDPEDAASVEIDVNKINTIVLKCEEGDKRFDLTANDKKILGGEKI